MPMNQTFKEVLFFVLGLCLALLMVACEDDEERKEIKTEGVGKIAISDFPATAGNNGVPKVDSQLWYLCHATLFPDLTTTPAFEDQAYCKAASEGCRPKDIPKLVRFAGLFGVDESLFTDPNNQAQATQYIALFLKIEPSLMTGSDNVWRDSAISEHLSQEECIQSCGVLVGKNVPYVYGTKVLSTPIVSCWEAEESAPTTGVQAPIKN
ncbi:hypothetical protein WDW89_22990 [Deltaproteobacteria bacterium TL4]